MASRYNNPALHTASAVATTMRNLRDGACGFCGEPINFTRESDKADLGRGWDHVATPNDWGFAEKRATRWHHVGQGTAMDVRGDEPGKNIPARERGGSNDS